MADVCLHWRLFTLLTCSLLVSDLVEAAPLTGALLVEKENVVEAQARGAGWKAAAVGTTLAARDKLRTGEFSRAAAQFSDRSILRIDELTTIEISPPAAPAQKGLLNLLRGGTYFFSREKPEDIHLRTPAVNGALRGTEFELRVRDDGYTTLTLFDGEVELSNAQGTLLLRSGERGEAAPGQRPRRTAMIEAVNIIQWCLYYPGVVDPADLKLDGVRALAPSLEAYRAGDLPGALTRHPAVHGGGSAAERVYRAAVMLSVGQVEKAGIALGGVPAAHPGRKALEQMIAAVKYQPWTSRAQPATASEWLAESYYRQSRSELEAALSAARRARELSPEFGFAATRVAELEFAFGRVPQAQRALKEGLELSPRHAQGHALQGFLLSARNDLDAARRSFDDAIAIDGALGNAWLGRGLVAIRRGDEEAGLRDLQVAAVLEPSRSVLRSYLAKAYSTAGDSTHAHAELKRAIEIDSRDPTPWLYSAVQKSQENRYNEAIADLERSIELNNNRSVFRSRFLLDQDRSIRGTNLASIYRNNDMIEQSVREAVRAVGADYASAPAHLFLANSYDALRDPNRVLLRYETAWFNELLLANLLSPVGGGPLSQYVSEQEYSKMFEQDGLGFSSLTDYFSTGEIREVASQFGTFGNVSYALDAEYLYNNGLRPNNRISRFEGSGTFKLQLGPQDTVLLQVRYADYESGNVFQLYDPDVVGRETSMEVPGLDGRLHKVVTKNVPANTYDFREEPSVMLAGWHHEWDPGNHTLLLFGRLATQQDFSVGDLDERVLLRDANGLIDPALVAALDNGELVRDAEFFERLSGIAGRGRLLDFLRASFDTGVSTDVEIYSGELQHIARIGDHTLVLGGRAQRGEVEAHARLTDLDGGLNLGAARLYPVPPADQTFSVNVERLSAYAYDVWTLSRWLSVTGGLVIDSLKYPTNLRETPLDRRQSSLDKLLPKAGATIQPWSGATIRGAYAETLGGSSLDASFRLEPTQVDGFLQTYRTLISESLIGEVEGSYFRLAGISFEQKMPTRTYLGLEWNVRRQDLDRVIGAFDSFLGAGGLVLGNVPTSLDQKNHYREDEFAVSLNQLVGDRWTLAARYRQTRSRLRTQIAGFGDSLELPVASSDAIAQAAERESISQLHEFGLSVIYNHPAGWFVRSDANWYSQDNDDFVGGTLPTVTPFAAPRVVTRNAGLPGDEFWQVDLTAGWRFSRNRGELSVGVLNLTDEDYRLYPLNPYRELPRERTFAVRLRLNF